MPAKKETTKKTTTSLRATAKQSSSEVKLTKIATSPAAPRNDSKKTTDSLNIPVYSLLGKEAGTISLPKEIFGQKVSKSLLSQALRVYTTNQKTFTAKTKTRGEVAGSTAKIFRQKGTGRARHGSIMAPIFVGGGIVFGPRPRNVRLELPKKMKKAALVAALSDKTQNAAVMALSGLEKASGKTKEMAGLMNKLNTKSALLVTGEKQDNVVHGVKNIPGIDVLPVNLINAYEVLKHQTLLVTKEALDKLEKGDKK
jgi:large subunit ribosomal protein L4